ncbi:MAG: hypothetical protein U5J63_16900 [Fodinibius sp.]|nr:hypothetical protein [Fodinibius sp.]
MVRSFYSYLTRPTVKDRLFFARTILCLGFISVLLVTYRQWINERFFPFAPVFDFIPILSPPLGIILLGGIITLLGILIFYPNKYIFTGFLGLVIYALLQDQARMYPVVYQFPFMLGAIIWFNQNRSEKRGKLALACIQIILIGIYIWSGLHKLNYVYLHETFQRLIGPLLEAFPTLESLPLSLLAVVTAVVETGAGLALAFRATQKYAAWILIGMHSFILLMVGPFGMEFNTVIWSWNISSILLLSAVFLGQNNQQAISYVVPRNFYHGVVVALFWVMPALNFAGLWDHYPSASLYSGKKPYARIHLTDNVKKKFSPQVQAKVSLLNELSIRDWSYTKLHAPDYPQPRVYKSIFRDLCQYQQQKYGLVLEIFGTADLITGKRKRQEYFCHELSADT